MDEEVKVTQKENPPVEEPKTEAPAPAPENNPTNDKLTVWRWIRFFAELAILIIIVILVLRDCNANSTKERIIDAVEHLQISESSDHILYWAIEDNLESPEWEFEKTDEEDTYNLILTGYAPNYDADVELLFEIHILNDEQFEWRIPLCELNGEVSTEQADINYTIAIIYDNVGESVVNSLTSYLLGL